MATAEATELDVVHPDSTRLEASSEEGAVMSSAIEADIYMSVVDDEGAERSRRKNWPGLSLQQKGC